MRGNRGLSAMLKFVCLSFIRCFGHTNGDILFLHSKKEVIHVRGPLMINYLKTYIKTFDLMSCECVKSPHSRLYRHLRRFTVLYVDFELYGHS